MQVVSSKKRARLHTYSFSNVTDKAAHMYLFERVWWIPLIYRIALTVEENTIPDVYVPDVYFYFKEKLHFWFLGGPDYWPVATSWLF